MMDKKCKGTLILGTMGLMAVGLAAGLGTGLWLIEHPYPGMVYDPSYITANAVFSTITVMGTGAFLLQKLDEKWGGSPGGKAKK